MATGFFALFDDIAALMDDVAVMSKVSIKKTAGILGDDLAVNAEKASGFVASRELPVLWAITKGSFINKLIILPIAFLLSAFLPWLVLVVLVLGGIYLAFEGAEKIYHFFAHKKDGDVKEIDLVILSPEEVLEQEKGKVKSAIITDFILSIEIVIIALGTVIGQPIMTQIIVVCFIAILATVGVYGVVALIVRMDDIGYSLLKKYPKKKNIFHYTGLGLVNALPKVIKALTIIGTVALFLVSGGIFAHNVAFLHNLLPTAIPSMLSELLLGVVVGLISLFLFKTIMGIINKIVKKQV